MLGARAPKLAGLNERVPDLSGLKTGVPALAKLDERVPGPGEARGALSRTRGLSSET
jgi:hypothetical protein